MKFKLLLIIFLLFLNFSSHGEENLLTIKQQLERLQREVNDLSIIVFTKNSTNNVKKSASELESETNISVFDMRIYNLEKDIKTLNSNFEDLTFQIDEIKDLFVELNIKLDNNIINESNNKENKENQLIEVEQVEIEKNTLGTININSEVIETIIVNCLYNIQNISICKL